MWFRMWWLDTSWNKSGLVTDHVIACCRINGWKLKSQSLCAVGVFSSWMKIEILEFVCYGHFLFMDENWNLGVCVLWAFSLHGWKLKSWSLCAMGIFSSWMKIEILEFVCYGHFLFMNENWNLGVCVLWAFSLHEWKLKSWSLCAMGIFSSWMKIEILELVCYGHFLFMNENWNLGACVLWAFPLHEWKLKSWSLCAMGISSSWMKIEILEFVCYGHFLFMDENWNLGVCVLWAFSLHGWKLKSWSLCAMGISSSWMKIEILEFVCYGHFLFMNENWNLGVCVLWAFPLHEWKLKSWSLCAMGISSSWMKIEILEFVCYGHFLFMNENWNLGVCVLWAFPLHEWKLKSWSLCAMGISSSWMKRKSWSLCAMGISSSWMKIEILEFVCCGCFLFLSCASVQLKAALFCPVVMLHTTVVQGTQNWPVSRNIKCTQVYAGSEGMSSCGSCVWVCKICLKRCQWNTKIKNSLFKFIIQIYF